MLETNSYQNLEQDTQAALEELGIHPLSGNPLKENQEILTHQLINLYGSGNGFRPGTRQNEKEATGLDITLCTHYPYAWVRAVCDSNDRDNLEFLKDPDQYAYYHDVFDWTLGSLAHNLQENYTRKTLPEQGWQLHHSSEDPELQTWVNETPEFTYTLNYDEPAASYSLEARNNFATSQADTQKIEITPEVQRKIKNIIPNTPNRTQTTPTQDPLNQDFDELADRLAQALYSTPEGKVPLKEIAEQFHLQAPGDQKIGSEILPNENRYGTFSTPLQAEYYGDPDHPDKHPNVMLYSTPTDTKIASAQQFKAPAGTTSEGVELPYILQSAALYDDDDRNQIHSLTTTVYNSNLDPIFERTDSRENERWITRMEARGELSHKIHHRGPQSTNQTPSYSDSKKDSWRSKPATKRQIEFLQRSGDPRSPEQLKQATRGELFKDIQAIKNQAAQDVKQARAEMNSDTQKNKNRTGQRS